MTYNCMIAGVGGQGSVLASRLVAEAAMRLGYNVRTTETIGMAQRGGSVVSHVRIGGVADAFGNTDSNVMVYSPLIPPGKAHALIAFEPAEAVRQLSYLAGRGALIVCDSAIKPITGALSGQTYDPETIIEYIKSKYPDAAIINGQMIKNFNAKTLNVAILGAAAEAGIFPFSAEDLLSVISEIKRFRDENIKSFKMGRDIYNEYVRQH